MLSPGPEEVSRAVPLFKLECLWEFGFDAVSPVPLKSLEQKWSWLFPRLNSTALQYVGAVAAN